MISSIISKDTREHRSRNLHVRLLAVCLVGVLLGIAAPLALPPLPAAADHGNRVLEVHPETDERNTVDSHTLTAALYDPEPLTDPTNPETPIFAPAPADFPIEIDFEILSGPGNIDGNSDVTNPDGGCTILSGTNSCIFSWNSGNSGVDIVIAWIDEDDDPLTFEGDRLEGRYSGPTDCQFMPLQDTTPPNGGFPPPLSCSPLSAPQPGRDAEPDITDVVQVSWSRDVIPTLLDCNPEISNPHPNSGPGSAVEFSCKLTDDLGDPIVGEQIDAENMGGANDTDNGDTGTADRNPFCTTGENGSCSGTFPAVEGQRGIADICFWHDADRDNAYSRDDALEEDGGLCGEEPDPGQPDDENTTDMTRADWDARSFMTLDAEPELMDRTAGMTHTVTITAFDQFDEPFRGLTNVFLEFFEGSPNDPDGNSPGSPDTGCNMSTQAGGDGSTCTVTYVSNGITGTDLMCSWSPNTGTPVMTGTSNPNGTCDGEGRPSETVRPELDVVQVRWVDGPVEPSPTQTVSPSPTSTVSPSPSPSPVNPAGDGYWLFREDGRVDAYGDSPDKGDVEGQLVGRDIVGADSHPNGNGYWMNDEFGKVYAFPDAQHFGDMSGQDLFAPMVGMQATPSGNGYWQVAEDGGVFTHGDAVFHGSRGGQHLVEPIVALISTPDGTGYWLIAADGGVFTYGSAVFHGSMGGYTLDEPVVGGDDAPDGNGYWLVATDGGVFTFGSARFFGSMADTALFKPVSGMSATPDGGGYNLVAKDGGVFAHGNARYFGGGGGSDFNPMIAIENRFNDGTRPA